MKRRRKKATRTGWARKACVQVQLYARLRDTGWDGYGACCCCGKIVHMRGGEGQGGHFAAKGRSYNAAAIDPRNVNLQCRTCNMPGSGSEAAYAVYMMAEYGAEVIEEIQKLRHQLLDWTEFRDACEKYKALNKEMLSEKGFE